jgi:hypothetical protein
MALSAPRSYFGIHSWTPYNRSTGLFYGTIKVLKGSSLSLQGETVKLMGGSQKYPWASEDGPITAEMSLKFNQYEDFVYELFLAKAPTTLSAETTGNVSTLTNKYGTSIFNASNGLDGVEVTSADSADLKFGKYVIKALSANTFDVYFSSDADIGRGTNGVYLTDSLKVASALSVASADAVMADWGLTFSKAGTPAFTTGDTATFEVRPVNTGGSTARIGGVADQTFPEFGSIVMAQKRGNNELTEFDCFRCKGVGMPIGLEMNSWSEAEVKIDVLYDSDKDGIFDYRFVKAT